jgi:Uma2 family endonuclease
MRPRVPLLENGDRLSRDEFERRYHMTPRHIKAELIDGVVYVASPVRVIHCTPQSDLITWLGVYRASTPGTDVADNGTDRMDATNEPQPDAMLYVDVDRSTRLRLSADGYLEGVPEFIGEVSASSVSKDLGPKMQAYARNGVSEYLVWRVEDEAIDWFKLRDGNYVRMEPDESGIIRSRVFPGLWLDVAAMADRNLAHVLAVLNQGVQSVEHTAFVATLDAMPRREVGG